MSIDPQTRTEVSNALYAIPTLVRSLHVEMVRATPTNGIRTRNTPNSKPPANTTILSDIDQTWRTLTRHANRWSYQHGFEGPLPLWEPVCEFLRDHWWYVAANNPGTFPQDTTQARDRLEQHLLLQKQWLPLPGRWRCPAQIENRTCGGILLQSLWIIRCAKCRSTWDGEPEFERLGRILGCELTVTIPQAAALADVHTRTIYRWIKERGLPTRPDKTIDKRDLLAMMRVYNL